MKVGRCGDAQGFMVIHKQKKTPYLDITGEANMYFLLSLVLF